MILVTGGMGFIGLHVARRLLDAGEDVVLTQHRARREPKFIRGELGGRAQVETVDIGDADALLEVARRHRVSGIVHLAVPNLGTLPAGDEYRVNMLGLVNVLEAARQAEVKRITLGSSQAVYSSLPRGPYREDALLPVQSRFAVEALKKAWDILATHYADRTGLDVVLARMGMIYGPLYPRWTNLPRRYCHAAVHGTEPDVSVERGGVPYAEDETDLCYVKDCAAGIALLQLTDRLSHRIYNVGSGRGTSNREVAEAVKKVIPDASTPLQAGCGPEARVENYMDITCIRQDTGYEPQYDINRAVAEYIAWLRENPDS